MIRNETASFAGSPERRAAWTCGSLDGAEVHLIVVGQMQPPCSELVES